MKPYALVTSKKDGFVSEELFTSIQEAVMEFHTQVAMKETVSVTLYDRTNPTEVRVLRTFDCEE